jgi:hypothetical protein
MPSLVLRNVHHSDAEAAQEETYQMPNKRLSREVEFGRCPCKLILSGFHDTEPQADSQPDPATQKKADEYAKKKKQRERDTARQHEDDDVVEDDDE